MMLVEDELSETLEPDVTIDLANINGHLDLQNELERQWQAGHRCIGLMGHWRAEHENAVLLRDQPLLRLGSELNGVTIMGTNPENPTILDASGLLAHVVVIEPGVTAQLINLTLQGGNTSVAAVQGDPQLTHRPQSSLYAAIDGGGLLALKGAYVKLQRVKIAGNQAVMCGGGLSVQGAQVELIDCEINGNVCGDTGAAIDALTPGSIVIVRRSRIHGNRSNLIWARAGSGQVSAFPDTLVLLDECIIMVDPECLPLDYHTQGAVRVLVQNCRFLIDDTDTRNWQTDELLFEYRPDPDLRGLIRHRKTWIMAYGRAMWAIRARRLIRPRIPAGSPEAQSRLQIAVKELNLNHRLAARDNQILHDGKSYQLSDLQCN